MKRTLAQIGYVAGLLERRGQMSELLASNRMELCFASAIQAQHVATTLRCKVQERKMGQRKSRFACVVSRTLAIGWLMTVYPLASPQLRDRIEQAVISWRAKLIQGRVPRCHSERRHYAKGLCKPCYQFQYHNGYVRRP